jgi:ribosomal protein S18 acetylase RimI-like enzyme
VKADGIGLRPATEGDYDFLVNLYGGTRQEELALTGWDADRREAFVRMQFAAQRGHYRAKRPEGREELILVDGEPAGRLYSDLGGDSYHLLDLCLLPEYRGRGIGGLVLTGIQAAAAARGRRVTIYVESFNRSLAFFERHGFNRSAESGVHCLMEWRPESDPVSRGITQGG